MGFGTSDDIIFHYTFQRNLLGCFVHDTESFVLDIIRGKIFIQNIKLLLFHREIFLNEWNRRK